MKLQLAFYFTCNYLKHIQGVPEKTLLRKIVLQILKKRFFAGIPPKKVLSLVYILLIKS